MPATLCTSSEFSRTQSAPSEQSITSLYNEAVKFHKAGLLQDAENKFRQALLRNKHHVSPSPAPMHFPTCLWIMLFMAWIQGLWFESNITAQRGQQETNPRAMLFLNWICLRNMQVPSLVGLGSLLKEKGDIQGGSKYLLEASGEISAPVFSVVCCVPSLFLLVLYSCWRTLGPMCFLAYRRTQVL